MSRRRVDDELLALYALDALGDEERRLVEDAVASSPALARDLREHQRVATFLAQDAAAAPPPDLKAKVLAAAFEVAAPREVTPTEAPAVVVPLRRDRRRPIATIVAGGLAAAAALAFAVIQLGGRSDAETVVLAGAAPGRLEVVVDDVSVQVEGSGLPAVGDDRTYQLWLVNAAGEPRSVGVFDPAADGGVDTRFEIDLGDANVLAVTIEPAGGSPTPTPPITYSAGF